jgi:membrane protease YdiL (CAAX protease family)
VIFVQTLAEEILFRGYLLRIWGAVVPFRLFTTSALMAAFISLHFPNADFKVDFWFNLIGFVLTQAVWCNVWFRARQRAPVCTGLIT